MAQQIPPNNQQPQQPRFQGTRQFAGQAANWTGRQAKRVGAGVAVGGLAAGAVGAALYSRRRRGYDWLILVTLIVYLLAEVWRWSWMSRVSIHLGVALFAWFLCLDKEEKNGETFVVMSVITLIEIFLPVLIYNFDFLMMNKWVTNYIINPQITALWFYFAVFRSSGETLISKAAKVFVVCLWIYIAFSLMTTAYGFEDIQTAMTPEQLRAAENLYVETFNFWGDIVTNLNVVMRQGKSYFINRMKYATGDYYTGQVDEKQMETLGVFLKNLNPADPEFYQGDVVTVWANLEAKTLEDGLSVNVSCYHGRKNKEQAFPEEQKGTVYPATIPLIFDQETVDIDCRFPTSQNMGEGSNKVTIQADFHFETMAYLKTYFMDRDNIRSMTRNGLDPLEEYAIDDKDPTARYTNGPVKIGMGSVEPPVGISDNYAVNPRIGVTLETNVGWKGKIKQLEELIIMVPDTMQLDTGFCPEFYAIGDEDYQANCLDNYKKYRSAQVTECALNNDIDPDKAINEDGTFASGMESCLQEFCSQELDNYNAYMLDINDNTKHLYQNFGYDSDDRKHKTFSCRINILEAQNILGNAQFSTEYYRAKARYIYQIEDDVNVNIKEVDPGTTNKDEPTKEGVENMPFVYRTWGEEVKKQCEETPLFEDVNECICYVSAIINVESRGKEKAKSSAGALGLMQVLPTTARTIAEKYDFGVTNPDLFNGPTNIKTGVHYIKHLQGSEWTGGDMRLVTAAYNGGECGQKTDGSWNGALCESKTCPGKLYFECEANNGYAETRAYVELVDASKNACMGLKLPTYAVLETEEVNKDDFMETVAINIEYTEHEINDFLSLELEDDRTMFSGYGELDGEDPTAEPTEPLEFTMKLKYKNYELFKMSYEEDELKRDELLGKWLVNKRYPFVRFMFNEELTKIDVQYFKNSIVFSPKLEEEARELNEQGQKQTKYSPLWTIGTVPYIEAYYDGGDITLFYRDYENNRVRFCEIPWDRDATYRYCGEDDDDYIPGFMVKNKETIAKEINSLPPYAMIQAIYDNDREHTCCENCKSDCNKKQILTCKDETCQEESLTKDLFSDPMAMP